MALDSNRAVRWVFDTLNADATLKALLGATTNIFRRKSSPGATPPYIVVALQSTAPPVGVIRTGHDTHTATPTTVRTSIWDKNTSANIERIADRIMVLLDGKGGQAVNGGGEVISCVKGTDIERAGSEGDDTWVGWDILWDIDVKA